MCRVPGLLRQRFTPEWNNLCLPTLKVMVRAGSAPPRQTAVNTWAGAGAATARAATAAKRSADGRMARLRDDGTAVLFAVV